MKRMYLFELCRKNSTLSQKGLVDLLVSEVKGNFNQEYHDNDYLKSEIFKFVKNFRKKFKSKKHKRSYEIFKTNEAEWLDGELILKVILYTFKVIYFKSNHIKIIKCSLKSFMY